MKIISKVKIVKTQDKSFTSQPDAKGNSRDVAYHVATIADDRGDMVTVPYDFETIGEVTDGAEGEAEFEVTLKPIYGTQKNRLVLKMVRFEAFE